ncbi:MAG TPA: FHA domain-containing protein [Thermoanaerobaculia bacterium]|nr:FHA domain-containing protein [Thermoanaerobaculia bacterium]
MVIVADKRCENGHFIDESWDLCPYCPADNNEPEIPIVRPTRFGSIEGGAGPRPVPVPSPSPSPSPSSSQVGANAAAAAALPTEGRRPAAMSAARRDSSPAIQAPPLERTVAVQKLEGAPKRYVVGWLIGLNGTVRGESFPVRMGRNVLGRDRRSDVVVNDDQASSHHADLVFRPEEKRFILMDHNSTNGTYVNEAEIEPRRDLVTKDVIRIGSHRFLFMPLCHEGFYWDDEGALK